MALHIRGVDRLARDSYDLWIGVSMVPKWFSCVYVHPLWQAMNSCARNNLAIYQCTVSHIRHKGQRKYTKIFTRPA